MEEKLTESKPFFGEGDGFLLLYKRLEDGKYQWPRNESEVRSITQAQLRWLTEGLSIDQPKAVRKNSTDEGILKVDIC